MPTPIHPQLPNDYARRAGFVPSTPTTDLDREVHRDRAKTPAIVQAAIRPFKLLQQQAAAHYKAYTENGESFLHDHDELKSRYKAEGFKTWNDCCLSTYGVTDDAIYKRVLKIRLEEQPTTLVKENLVAREDDKALRRVERARETPREEEPERPRVKTADEVIAENGHVEPVKPQARTENGRPKNQLAIWKEIEESLFGRALNRVDELNRQCPNSKFHGEIISWTKNCMRILEAWRESVK